MTSGEDIFALLEHAGRRAGLFEVQLGVQKTIATAGCPAVT